MKLNRRNTITAIVGGIFAPKVAESMPAGSLPEKPQATTLYGGEAVGKDIVVDPFWKQKEIAKYEKIANGEFDSWHMRTIDEAKTTYTSEEEYINSLKSVSLSYKVHLRNKYTVEKLKRNFIRQAIRHLLSLKEDGKNEILG